MRRTEPRFHLGRPELSGELRMLQSITTQQQDRLETLYTTRSDDLFVP